VHGACPGMDPKNLLAVTRSRLLAKRLQAALDVAEYHVRWVSSTTQALKFDLPPALIVLDLPPAGGGRSIAVLRRRFAAPILALRPPGQSSTAGADASLERPFEVERLAQLIQSTLATQEPGIIRAPGMCLDTRSRRLQINDTFCQLTPIASQLLAVLMASAGRVIAREELFHRVWNTDQHDNTRALDVHIVHLRRQMESDPRHPRLIVTDRGLGYRLQPPSALCAEPKGLEDP
jgi:two-component system KDP operon response regulator KdpE